MASDESIVVASLLAQLTAEKRRGVAAENEADGHPAKCFFFLGFIGFIRFYPVLSRSRSHIIAVKLKLFLPLSEFVVKIIQ